MAANTNFFATSDETESRFYRFLELIAKGGVYKSADKDFHPFKGTSYQEKTKQAHFFMDALSPQSLSEFSYGRAKLLTLPGLSYSPYNINPLAFAHAVRKMLPTDIRRSLYLYHLMATKDVSESDSDTYQNGLQHPLHYYAGAEDMAQGDELVLQESNLKRYLVAINEDILITQDDTNESTVNSTQLFDSAFTTLEAMGLLTEHPTIEKAYHIVPNPIVEAGLSEEEIEELRYALDFQKQLSPISSYAHYVQYKLSLSALEEGSAPQDYISESQPATAQQPSPILVRQVPPFKTLLDDTRLATLASMNTWCTLTTIDRDNPKTTSKLDTTKTIGYITNLEERQDDSREYIYSTSKYFKPMTPLLLDAVQCIEPYPSTPHSRKQVKAPNLSTLYINFHTCPTKHWKELQQHLYAFQTQRLSITFIPHEEEQGCPFLVKVTYPEKSLVYPLIYQWGPYIQFVNSAGEPLTDDSPEMASLKEVTPIIVDRVRSILSHYES